MAKFTSDEVEALQAGGNERAKQIYFKEWDPVRNSHPDSNNMHRLRDFIKHVYVDKRFSGGTSSAELPKLRLAEKEEPNQSRSVISFRIEAKSSDSGDRFERTSSERSSPSLRSEDNNVRFSYDHRSSPRYSQNYTKRNSLGRRPVKFEVVDDRIKDDDIRSRKPSNWESKLRQLQPGSQKNSGESQWPVVCSSGQVFEGPSPKVGETSQAYNSEAHDVQKNKASNAAAKPETQHISQPSEDNWATFDYFSYKVDNAAETSNSNTWMSSVTEKTPQATTYANSLDILLFDLSGPSIATTVDNNEQIIATVENASTSGDLQLMPSTPIWQTTPSPKNCYDLSVIPTNANDMEQPSNAVHSHVDLLFDIENCSNEVSDGKKLSSMQFPPSVSVDSGSTTQKPCTAVTPASSNNMSSYVLDSHDSSGAFGQLSPHTTAKPVQDTKPDFALETKSSGRMELPEDLFTSSYSPGPAAPSLTGWQNDVQPHGMGYGMQYNPNSVPSSSFPISPMSRNPFDEIEGKTLTHASSFPTMTSLHSALPSTSPKTGLMHGASLGSLGMMPQSPTFGSPVHSQSNFSSGFTSGGYFGQVNNNMQPPRPDRAASFSDDRSPFGSLRTMQPSGGGEYMTSATPNSFPKKGGNPFGDD